MPVPPVERIDEAAFVPESWPTVLDEVGEASGSASGALQILKGGEASLWAATDRVRDTLGAYLASCL